MPWREMLTHDHPTGPRWIVPAKEHPEFAYLDSKHILMRCTEAADHGTHARDGIRVLEDGKDEHCVRCGALLEPVRAED